MKERYKRDHIEDWWNPEQVEHRVLTPDVFESLKKQIRDTNRKCDFCLKIRNYGLDWFLINNNGNNHLARYCKSCVGELKRRGYEFLDVLESKTKDVVDE